MRFCFCLVLVLLLASCSSKYYMKRGTVLYESGRFYKASSKYEKAFDKSKVKEFQTNAAMRAGMCCEQAGRYKEAYNWYRKAVNQNKELPEAYLKAAQMAALTDNNEGAADYYTQYGEKFDDGKGKDGLYNLELVRKDQEVKGRYTVELKKEFNSRNSDFAPVYYPGDTCIVYFASTRSVVPGKRKSKIDPITGDGYSHIFITDYTQEIKTVDKLGNVGVKRFKDPRWLKPALVRDSLYSTRHEGAMCFSADGGTLYFTSSRMIEGSNRGTRIYKATKGSSGQGNGENQKKGWVGLSKSGICGDTISIGHPALTPDGGRMYFATDGLPGGFGGKDIWYVENTGGKWGPPENAGELVNTAGDELYPYVRDNGELYFASNGHYGFGGLDIYKVKDADGKQRLEHLPAPLNSFADDFGIVYKPELDEGLLTSSRSGRSDNIYSFGFIPQQLQVRMLAKNSITEAPVGQVNVTVTCDDGSVSYLVTDSAGVASMVVVPDREYIFATEDPRFLRGKGVVSTYREKADRLYDLTVDIQPIEKPIVIPNIYFDVAKWELRPDAKENLQELLAILQDNPNITVELSAHTDMVGNDQANMVLSENRAKSVVDYLIDKDVYWDRLQAKGYGETKPRQINERDAKAYPFLKTGDILNEPFVNRLKGGQKEEAMQLNRRIEFRVLRTNYKPGPDSKRNPSQIAVAAEDGVQQIGATQIKDLKSIQGKFFTLQLGVFKNVPVLIDRFRVVFTEKAGGGAVRYCTGIYDTREEAKKAAEEWKKKGVESIVKEYN